MPCRLSATTRLAEPQAIDRPSFAHPTPHTTLPAPANRVTGRPSATFHRYVSLSPPPVLTAREPSADAATAITVFECSRKMTRRSPVSVSSVPAHPRVETPPQTST